MGGKPGRYLLRLLPVLLLLVPATLSAHARLLSSSPAQGAVLSVAPTEVRLTFSERIALALASVKLVAGNDTLESPSLTLHSADSRTLVATFPAISVAGPYRVLWRIASRDGHPITGTIDFSVGAAGPAVGPADSTRPMPAPPTEFEETRSGTMAIAGALGSIVVRWAAFTSLFAMLGAVMFRFVIIPRANEGTFGEIASTNAATLGLASALVFLIASLLKVARESSDMPDIPMSTMLTASAWGCAMLAQSLAAFAAAIAFRASHSSNAATRSAGWAVAAASSLVIAVALPFTGHAFGGDRTWIAVPADIVHLLAGAVWLGTLASIVIVGIPAAFKSPDGIRPGARVAAMVNAFSPIALMSGGIVIATGIGSSLIRLGGIGNLRTTPYGGALMLKLLFVVFLFGAGAWNWRRIKPRLTTDEAIVPLRRSATLELSIAAIVLAVTAVLVALELP